MRRHPMRTASGFTLIELLVVIAIMALLISILLPALAKAKERGRVAVCQSNLRTMTGALIMYSQDQEGTATPYLPWYIYPSYPGYSISLYTPWIFSGVRRTVGAPGYASYSADSSIYPTEIRPINRYIMSAGMSERDANLPCRCPSDRTNAAAIIGQSPVAIPDDPRGSFDVYGNSYTLNARWLQGYRWNSAGGTYYLTEIFDTPGSARLARKLIPHIMGGGASKFVLIPEQGFYAATYRAGPDRSQPGPNPQQIGWHREFSKWSLGFADGHAEYRYFDTRFAIHPDVTIWQPNWREADGN